MVWKELVQLRRDPMALTLSLFIPVALLFIFGYAINTDVKHLPTVVFDQSRDVEAARLRGRGGAAIQVIVDASDPQVAVSAVNASNALGLARSVELLRQRAGIP